MREISIRHNGFHVGSFRFASSRYIRFALLKNRLAGSNPMRRTDIFPVSVSIRAGTGRSFCAQFFILVRALVKSLGSSEILRGKSVKERRKERNKQKKREGDRKGGKRCNPFACDSDSASGRCPPFRLKLFTSRFFRESSLSNTRDQISILHPGCNYICTFQYCTRASASEG